MNAYDIYRMRAEEFERNFESLRGIEWRTTFEIFAGYAAIGIAYFHLHAKHGGCWRLGAGATAVTLILFLSHCYFSLRIQERMRYARAMMNEYLKELHRICNAKEIPAPAGVKEPIRKGWWAFGIQLALSITVMLSLIIYIAATTECACRG